MRLWGDVQTQTITFSILLPQLSRVLGMHYHAWIKVLFKLDSVILGLCRCCGPSVFLLCSIYSVTAHNILCHSTPGGNLMFPIGGDSAWGCCIHLCPGLPRHTVGISCWVEKPLTLTDKNKSFPNLFYCTSSHYSRVRLSMVLYSCKELILSDFCHFDECKEYLLMFSLHLPRQGRR